MVDNLGMQLVLALAQLVIGLVFSIGSIYISLKMFDKFTKEIDEWKEIRKGNVAVGLLLGGVIFSIAIIIESGVSGITRFVTPEMGLTPLVVGFVIGILNLLISVFAAVVSVYLAIRVLDWITTDIDELAELKKGNVAVAVMMVGVLIAVSFVIRGAVAGILQVVNTTDIIRLLGL